MREMEVGRIAFGPFGPFGAPGDAERWRESVYRQSQTIPASPHACHCTGPRVGQSKCPCALRAEAEQGRRMVRDGVVINGVEYDLVPRKAKG